LEKYDEAIKCYDAIIALDDKYVYAWNNKGLALERLEKYDEAIKCYNKAIEVDPSFLDAWSSKGLALERLEEYDEAIKCYDAIIAIDAKNIDAWNSKGNCYFNLEKYDEAIKCYDAIIALDDKYVYAWNNKGLALERLGKYDEVIKCYNKAIEVDPSFLDAWGNKGLALERLGKYDEAIKCYDAIIAIDAKNIDAWNSRGSALISSKNYGQAIKSYTKSLEIDSENKNAIAGLRSLYSDYVYDFSKALEQSTKLIKLEDSILSRMSLVENLVKMQKYSESRKEATKILNKKEDEVNITNKVILKFLILCSFTLENDEIRTGKELNSFILLIRNLANDFKIDKDTWVFNGMLHAILNSSINIQSKFLLSTLIDLMVGRITKKNISALSYV